MIKYKNFINEGRLGMGKNIMELIPNNKPTKMDRNISAITLDKMTDESTDRHELLGIFHHHIII